MGYDLSYELLEKGQKYDDDGDREFTYDSNSIWICKISNYNGIIGSDPKCIGLSSEEEYLTVVELKQRILELANLSINGVEKLEFNVMLDVVEAIGVYSWLLHEVLKTDSEGVIVRFR